MEKPINMILTISDLLGTIFTIHFFHSNPLTIILIHNMDDLGVPPL
jgi:hypothetical protein